MINPMNFQVRSVGAKQYIKKSCSFGSSKNQQYKQADTNQPAQENSHNSNTWLYMAGGAILLGLLFWAHTTGAFKNLFGKKTNPGKSKPTGTPEIPNSSTSANGPAKFKITKNNEKDVNIEDGYYRDKNDTVYKIVDKKVMVLKEKNKEKIFNPTDVEKFMQNKGDLELERLEVKDGKVVSGSNWDLSDPFIDIILEAPL